MQKKTNQCECHKIKMSRRPVSAGHLALMATTALVGILPSAVFAQEVIDGGASETVIGTGGGTQASPWNIGDTLTVGEAGTGSLTISDGGVVTNTIGRIGDLASGSGIVNITGSTSEWQNSSLMYVGYQGEGMLNVTDATVEASAILIGQASGSSGAVSISGSTAQMNATVSNLIVGYSGMGTLDISDGATVTAAGDMLVAYSSGGGGSSVTVDNASLEVGGDLTLGRIETGTLTVQNGGTLETNGFVNIGVDGGAGTLNLTGAGTIWDNEGAIFVGTGGTGHIIVSDGAEVLGQSFDLTLGSDNSSGVGNLQIDNAAWNNAAQVSLGADVGSHGELMISSGGSLSSTDNVLVGDLGSGIAVVSGPGSVLTASGGLYLGNSDGGTGLVTISDGGEVDVSDIVLGAGEGAAGTINLTGENSSLIGDGELLVGDEGTGALNIIDGTVSASSTIYLGYAPTGEGSALISGSTASLSGTSLYIAEEGTGSLTISDGGTVSVSGIAYLGFDPDADGTLNIGAAAGDAAVGAGTLDAAELRFGDHEDAKLFFNHTDSAYEFDADMSGEGRIYQLAGETILSGDSSGFTGTTAISGGTLLVDGTLGGNVVAITGGIIGGSGTLSGVASIGSGSTLSPGNSVGTINAGSVIFDPGSIYEVELNDGGFVAGSNNDLLNATGAVIINGGTLHVTPENGTDNGTTYTPGTYTIITAGTLAGQYDSITDDYAFLDFTDSYDYTLNEAYLTSSIAVTSFCLSGMTANECAAGEGTFSLGIGNNLFDAVLGFSNPEAPIALNLLSGEIHASAQTALVESSRLPREAAMDRIRQAFDGVDTNARTEDRISGVAGLWGQGFGSVSQWNSDGNAAALDHTIGGFLMGADASVLNNINFGIMGGYSRSNFSVDNRTSTGTADTFTLGAYGGGQWGAISLKGGIAHSWHDLVTSRSVSFTGFSDNLSAAYSAQTLQAWGEAAISLETGVAQFEPFINFAHVNLSTDSFTETGGAAALNVASSQNNETFTTLGLRAEADVRLGSANATLRGMLGWRHQFGDTPTSQMSFASGGDSFTIAGVPLTQDSLVLDAGFDVDLNENAKVDLTYGAVFGSGNQNHSAKISLNVIF